MPLSLTSVIMGLLAPLRRTMRNAANPAAVSSMIALRSIHTLSSYPLDEACLDFSALRILASSFFITCFLNFYEEVYP
jgi:hypothetical protein